MVDRSIQSQIPAARVRDIELANVHKFPVERADQLLCLALVKVESAGIGEDDAFVMETQMNRVGAQPVAIACRRGVAFAVQAERPETEFGQTELFTQCDFEGLARAGGKPAMRQQPFQAGQGQLA